jgi:hypothetical protein
MLTFVEFNIPRFLDNSGVAHKIWDSEVFLLGWESIVMNSVFVKHCDIHVIVNSYIEIA